MTPDLTCPSTQQLLRSSFGYSRPNASFNLPASLKYLSGLARASLAEVFKLQFFFGSSEGDYTSLCLASLVLSSYLVSARLKYLAIDVMLLKTCYFVVIMAKRDMDFYHSRLTQDDLNELIIKYKISCDLHPRLPSEEFVMSELLDDAIGVFPRKGIINDVDAAVVMSVGASRLWVSSDPVPSFKELSGDAIHRDFFPFSPGPYYDIYPEGGIAGNYKFTCEEWDAHHQPTLTVLTKEVFKDPSVYKTVVDQFPRPRDMVRIKALSSDQLTAKMSVLYCLMMSHGGEILARYRGLLQSHHEYVQSTDSRLKGYQEKFASLTGLESQVSALQRQITGLNDKLSASDASFAKSKAKGKERKRKIKSLTKSFDSLHAEVARLFADLNRAAALVWKFLASDEFSRVQAELLSLAASAGFERGLSMHRTKEEFTAVLKKISQFVNGMQDRLEPTVTLASTSLDLLSNTVPTSSTDALEPNEEWGVSHVVDDVTELTVTGSERVSSGTGDVVVALSAREKGDGSVPSSTVEDVATPPSRA
ncbi:hypothetical protein Tco_0577591 [Tanacetum coccineum]